MDRGGARPAGGLEDRRLVEIALRCRAAAYEVGLVGVRDVRRGSIRLRVDSDSRDPELPIRCLLPARHRIGERALEPHERWPIQLGLAAHSLTSHAAMPIHQLRGADKNFFWIAAS